mgnify:CR=1
MAQNEYIIRVVNDSEGEASPVTDAGTGTKKDSAGNEKSYWAKSAESAKSAARKIVSVSTAGMVADRLVSYEINTVSLRTGAREYEQKLQLGYSVLKQTAVPLVIGAVTGGLPGAIIGGLFSVAMQSISWGQNARTIDYNRQLENFSITMASERAGWSGSRSNRQ